MATIWQFFTKKKALSYLLMIALVVVGLSSIFSIRKESAPEIQVPVAIITTALPGASPEDVENLITNEIEQEVNTIENIDNITSTSRTGISSIVVEFDASADIESSIQDVKDAVDIAKPELPDDATEPVVDDINFADDPIQIIAISSDSQKAVFKKLTEDVVDELERINGISRVAVAGIEDREVTVIVEPASLVAHNLTLQDVTNALRNYNTSLPVGDIEVSGVTYSLTFEGDLEDTSAVEDVPIQKADGSFVFLRDIAFVADGLTKQSSLSRISVEGEPSGQAATLILFKQRGADITAVTGTVKDTLDELGETLLKDSDVAISFDAGDNITTDLINLSSSGGQTVALVLLTLLIALGWREAVVAALAIPLSFLVAFIGLYISGNTINFISLFSLILTIGILVDSAIVIVEAIHSNMKEAAETGGDKQTAALKAIKDFHFPLSTGTLTTVAFFVPLFTISGITGEFLAMIPFTVIFVLLASLVVALAFIPLIASSFLRRRTTSKMEQKQEALSHTLQNWYRARVTMVLGHRVRENIFMFGAFVAFIVAVVVFPMVGLVKPEFFPEGDEGLIYVEAELPQGTTLGETDLAIRAIEDVLYEFPEIESFTSAVGQGSNFNQNSGSGERVGSIDVVLRDEREKTSIELVTEIENALKLFGDYKITVGQIEGGPPTGSPVVITFLGDDLDELNQLASKATRLLEDVEGTRNVTNSAQDDSAEFRLTIDRAKAAEVGVTPAQVAGTLRTAVFGTDATTIKNLDEDIDVVVKLNLNPDRIGAHDTNETNIDRIMELPIATPNGTVLLGSILDASFGQAQERIRHEDLERIATVSSDLEPDVFSADVNARFAEVAEEELDIPPGITMNIGGENEDIDQSFADMFRALILGIIFAFAIIVIQFNSIKQSLFIMLIIPLSLIGVMTGLAMTQLPLSLPAMLGFIALAGIVINNGIILIDVINKKREAEPWRNIDEVVLDGATARLRPILLTTITTVVGISPLIWVSQIWRPIAFAIIFGLTFAVFLTLIFVPIIYRRFHDRSALWAMICGVCKFVCWPFKKAWQVVRR